MNNEFDGWTYAVFEEIQLYEGIKVALDRIQRAVVAQKAGMWKDLCLEICDGYDDSRDLKIVGYRPQTTEELLQTSRDKTAATQAEFTEYLRLEAKYGH